MAMARAMTRKVALTERGHVGDLGSRRPFQMAKMAG
jgi:hypothetical protein